MSLALKFDYIAQQNQGSVKLRNTGTDPVQLSEFSFTSNTNITSAWGELLPWGATCSTVDHKDGTYTHTVTYDKPFTINPGQNLPLSYNFDTMGGSLGLAMPPATVTVTPTTGPTQDLQIDDAYSGSTPVPFTKGYNSTIYYESWAQYSEKVNATDIPVQQINEIIYAFITFDANGGVKLADAYSDGKQLPDIFKLKLKTTRQNEPSWIKSRLSFGGWGQGDLFSQMTANENARKTFVTNAIQAVIDTRSEGMDVDWEYPLTQLETQNYITLLKELQAEFIRRGLKPSITIAAPAGIDKISALTQDQWKTITDIVDRINVMTYDYFGAWNATSGFLAPMQLDPRDPAAKDPISKNYNVVSTMQAYSSLGIPPSKLGVGLSNTNRTAIVASSTKDNEALYQPITGTPPGEFDNTGVFRTVAVENAKSGQPGNLPADMVFPNSASDPNTQYSKTPIGYSVSKKVFLSYEDADSAAVKTHFALQQGIQSMMMWTVSGDVLNNPEKSMIQAVFNTFDVACKKEAKFNQEQKVDALFLAKASLEVVKFKAEKLLALVKNAKAEFLNVTKKNSEIDPHLFQELYRYMLTLGAIAKNVSNVGNDSAPSAKIQKYFEKEKEVIALFKKIREIEKSKGVNILSDDARRLCDFQGTHCARQKTVLEQSQANLKFSCKL